MPMFAGKSFTIEQIRGTANLLRYYRRFLKSNYERCRVVENADWFPDPDGMTKAKVRRRLAFLVHVAINRKAGVPDAVGRKQDTDYQRSLWRDVRAVRDKVNRRVIVRQFETPEIRTRYGHLLTRWEDE